MDRKAKKLWVDALRSGEYKQTKGKLCSVRGAMCCLGVLIDVTQDGEWELARDGGEALYEYKGFTGILSLKICDDLGLNQFDMNNAALLNDQCGYSFKQIADWVEATL